MILIKRIVAASLLLVGSLSAMAASMDITASFTPSTENPENNAFTNTTPQGGYCSIFANDCRNNNIFSIALPFTLTRTLPIMAYAEPRNGIYYKMPSGWRTVVVRNDSDNTVTTVKFRVSIFSARYVYSGSNTTWEGRSHLGIAISPCSTAAQPWGAGGSRPWMHFAWRFPQGDNACYVRSTVDRDDQGVNYLNPIEQLSIAYDIATPNPLTLSAGVYTGQLPLTIGPGGDFDFGDNYQASDNELTINFTLSVNHELKLTTTADDQKVSLQPCALGRNCTEEEGKASWERWMVTRVTPQLSGRSNFRLSSSGAFTVYLQCEQQSGEDCGLRSDNNPSQVVPVQSLLTLPDNIVDQSTGATVVKRRLAQGRDLTRNVFLTRSYGENKAGSIDFLVSQRDVDTMLKTRPDTYRGAVTVIFDPEIY